MSLHISILGWSSLGLRCPDHTVSLEQSNSINTYPVTLIQMPNGTGKTTTLNMLRATLSGAATTWNRDEIISLRRSDSSKSSGKFIVRLAIDNARVTYELNFNFEDGNINYRTTFNSGIKDKFDTPPKLKKFLNPKFIQLFIFDGELASHLLDAKHTRAREAIDDLFQLYLLEDLERKFQENWQSHADKAGATEERGLARRRNKLNDLRKKQETIKREQKELHQEKSKLDEDIQKNQIKYDEIMIRDEDIGAQLKEVRDNLDQSEKNVATTLNQAISKMRDPQSLVPHLATSLINLKENLDSLKLPTSTSKEFFEDLAKAEECICGRPMDDSTRQAVRDRANNYLGEEEVGILNSIKSDIANYCEDPDKDYQALQQTLKVLGNFVKDRDTGKTQLSSIEEERLKQGDSNLEETKTKLDKLKKEQEQVQKKLDEIERYPHAKINDSTDSLKELSILIDQAEEDLAEITHTLELRGKTEIVRKILSEAHQQARETLRKYLVDETNNRIAKLLTRDPVLLEDIQDSLQLKGKSGASVGQTLSVSYAFLATLFNRSDHQLPFIIDSPAGALDLKVRPEVARLVPKLCQQFIAFTISSERQGFVDVLHETSQQQVQYMTIFRKTDRMNALWNNLDSSLVLEESDGVLVKGKEFFDRFDLDEEI
ncbi:MAG: AAA family ATPase [Geitlerinemataceae cyanobacterium]